MAERLFPLMWTIVLEKKGDVDRWVSCTNARLLLRDSGTESRFRVVCTTRPVCARLLKRFLAEF